MWNVSSSMFGITTVHVLGLWKSDLSISTPWHKNKPYLLVHLLSKGSSHPDISIWTYPIISNHCSHLVSYESAISRYCKLERLIIHNDGKMLYSTVSSNSVLLSPLLPCFQFSSTAGIPSKCRVKEEGTQPYEKERFVVGLMFEHLFLFLLGFFFFKFLWNSFHT